MVKAQEPLSFVGQKNVYQCDECLGLIVTVDRDHGVTPFMIGCQARNGCGGRMQSSLYRVFQRLVPSFEWYSPDEAERATLPLGTRDHVARGGLLLRRIVDHEASADAVKASLHK